MLNYLEESFYTAALLKRTLPKHTLAVAQRIIADASKLCATGCDLQKIAKHYLTIEPALPDASERAARAAVAACIALQGAVWQVMGSAHTWNIVPRVQQVAAALELSRSEQGQFALQRTGEGKTITILVTIALLACRGRVHVMTANEYLAERDYQWIGPVLQALGIKCSLLTREDAAKRACYGSSVLFGSDKEFLFDYLRDAQRDPETALRCTKREQIIVDEGDHILLDELMTPAIISRGAAGENQFLAEANNLITLLLHRQKRACERYLRVLQAAAGAGTYTDKQLIVLTALRYCGVASSAIQSFLEEHQDGVRTSERYQFGRFMKGDDNEWYQRLLYVTVDWQENSCSCTERGMWWIETRWEQELFTLPLASHFMATATDHYQRVAALQNALTAHLLLRRDIDYIIQGKKIAVITRSLGRADSQKQFSWNLAEAVAIKEEILHHTSSVTASRTTVAALVNEYTHRIALSGTLLPDHRELSQLYQVRPFLVPTHKKIIARHHPGRIYPDKKAKFAALLEDVCHFHAIGRPVLIGTNTIVTSEKIGALLLQSGIPCALLTAKNEDEEATILAGAGAFGAVIVATNMAGRGCDIAVTDATQERIAAAFTAEVVRRVDLQLPVTIRCESGHEAAFLCRVLHNSGITPLQHTLPGGVVLLVVSGDSKAASETLFFGLGLHVIVAECSPSRRIETQLRGRTGRQGNPGSSSLYIALDDDALLPVPSVRSFALQVTRWFGFSSSFWNRFLLSIIHRATEQELRFQRTEHLFYDTIAELIRKRFVEMRNQTLSRPPDDIVRLVLAQYLGYVQEELLVIREFDDKVAMLRLKLQSVFAIFDEQLLTTLAGQGCFDVGTPRLLAGVLSAKKRGWSALPMRRLFCALADEVWSSFCTDLEQMVEQAHLFAFAGRDPKTIYVTLTFEKWHAANYLLYELYLTELFRLPLENRKMALATSAARTALDALFAR